MPRKKKYDELKANAVDSPPASRFGIDLIDTPAISIQLRNAKGSPRSQDYWPLATIKGGIETMTVTRRGRTLTLKIVSPDAAVWSDGWNPNVPGWERHDKERKKHFRLLAAQAKAAPG